MKRLDVELSDDELTALLSDYSPDVLHYGRATIVDDRVSRLVRDYAAARKELAEMRGKCDEAAAIMAWLRAKSNASSYPYDAFLDDLIDAIERGEWRKEKP